VNNHREGGDKKVIHIPPSGMGATPHIGGPSPRIPPYIVSYCQFGGDNTIDNAKKFLGKNLSFFGYLLL